MITRYFLFLALPFLFFFTPSFSDVLDSRSYAGKVVLVTGGSKGIGEGCVRAFVSAASHVIIADIDWKNGERLAEELNHKESGSVFFQQCDVTKEEEIKGLIAFAVDRYGKIDCLVNNAGWHPPAKRIDAFSVEECRKLMDLNFISFFTACKYALPHLRKSQGNIINMSSLTATLGQRSATTYVATKGAISSFTRALAIDEAIYGVRVNSISPSNIWTPLWDACAQAEEDPQAVIYSGENSQQLGRMGSIEEVGELALFIASKATFTTGSDYFITGGSELGYGHKNHLVSTK